MIYPNELYAVILNVGEIEAELLLGFAMCLKCSVSLTSQKVKYKKSKLNDSSKEELLV